MALQPIGFGDGSTLQILIGSNNCAFDAAGNNILLGSPASTFGFGVTSSALMAGDSNNIAAGSRHIILGGNSNSITGAGSESCSILGGSSNMISSTGVWNHILNGSGNTISGAGNVGTISSGNSNTISATGNGNYISGSSGSIINGSSALSTIMTGDTNIINGCTGTLISGTLCQATNANRSALFGYLAKTTASGTFVFTDTTVGSSTLSTADAAGLYVTNGVVVADTANVQPEEATIFKIDSILKGFRGPVMTTAQRLNIFTTRPQVYGLEVFDLDVQAKFVFTNTGWQQISSGFAVTSFTTTINFSGPWSSTANINVAGERVGNTVSLWFGNSAFPTTTTGFITASSGSIPVGFRPIHDTYVIMQVVDDTQVVNGSVLVDNVGGLNIGMSYANPTTGIVYQQQVFQNLGTAGWPFTSVTYLISG